MEYISEFFFRFPFYFIHIVVNVTKAFLTFIEEDFSITGLNCTATLTSPLTVCFRAYLAHIDTTLKSRIKVLKFLYIPVTKLLNKVQEMLNVNISATQPAVLTCIFCI